MGASRRGRPRSRVVSTPDSSSPEEADSAEEGGDDEGGEEGGSGVGEEEDEGCETEGEGAGGDARARAPRPPAAKQAGGEGASPRAPLSRALPVAPAVTAASPARFRGITKTPYGRWHAQISHASREWCEEALRTIWGACGPYLQWAPFGPFGPFQHYMA